MIVAQFTAYCSDESCTAQVVVTFREASTLNARAWLGQMGWWMSWDYESAFCPRHSQNPRSVSQG